MNSEVPATPPIELLSDKTIAVFNRKEDCVSSVRGRQWDGFPSLCVAWEVMRVMASRKHNFYAMVIVTLLGLSSRCAAAPSSSIPEIDASTFRGRIMCGYQGWFRCPGDAMNEGWIHWSRDSKRLAKDTLTVEMWPDLTEYGPTEKFPAGGFEYPGGSQAYLFSSDNADTVLRHFQWMRDYGIDGAWLQHFAVDLPGGPMQSRYTSRLRVLRHVQRSAAQTGRVWALTYDITGMPDDEIFQVVTDDWKRMVDDGTTNDPRYVHEGRRPVVQIFGFYFRNSANAMNVETARKLIDFFKAPGRYSAFLFGGGDWNWRQNPDPAWQSVYRRFDAYAPWNVGNTSSDAQGVQHATTSYWADDRKECERNGCVWVPVVYPGFSWDNLQRKPPGATLVPRRGGKFLWEQFHALSEMKQNTVYVAMFDEVDEGTAIFKVTNNPPSSAHFVGYEGLPSDWYLRLVGEGTRMLRGVRPPSINIPIEP